MFVSLAICIWMPLKYVSVAIHLGRQIVGGTCFLATTALQIFYLHMESNFFFFTMGI